MINFDKEVAKFKPSLELQEIEGDIAADDPKDMTDLLLELMETIKKNNKSEAR